MTKLLLAIAMAVSVLASPAYACKGGKVQFADDFRDVDPAWNIEAAPDRYAISGGKLAISPDAKITPLGNWTNLYTGSFFGDADICVTITFPTEAGAEDASGGIAFWATDINNLYKFGISPAGTASIIRWQNGKVLMVASWRKTDALKTTPGATNTIRVTLNGSSAATYINDKPFVTIKGQPPEGGSEIGLSASAGQRASFPFLFSDLKVTDLPK